MLAPHADDETFGCGGTIALHAASGDPVMVVVLTDGARGNISRRYLDAEYIRMRRDEAREACRILGAADPIFLEFADRSLWGEIPRARGKLMEILEDFRPERIYAPSMLEYHPDHRAAAALLLTFMGDVSPDLEIAFWEINQPLCVNCLVDISPVLSQKEAAIRVYKTQLEELDYADHILSLNRFRAMTLPLPTTHAEGFSLWPAYGIRRWLSYFDRSRKPPRMHGYTGLYERQLPFLDVHYGVEPSVAGICASIHSFFVK
ncbi:MAG: PIG-L family deacetylase [Deltaproteobacteria bacterium]